MNGIIREFLSLRQPLEDNAPRMGAGFFYFSPLNVVPKLALEKLVLTEVAGTPALSSLDGSVVRLIPCVPPEDYYRSVLAATESKQEVVLVPEVIGNHLRQAMNVSRMHNEYIFETERVISHSGGKLQEERRKIRLARKETSFLPYDRELAREVNKAWYREAADRHFRTYDKTSIDWLIDHWEDFAEEVPDACFRAIQVEGEEGYASFSMACKLTSESWTTYTTRKRPNHRLKGLNLVTFLACAEEFRDLPYTNDGTADNKGIRQNKERLAYGKLPALKVEGR